MTKKQRTLLIWAICIPIGLFLGVAFGSPISWLLALNIFTSQATDTVETMQKDLQETFQEGQDRRREQAKERRIYSARGVELRRTCQEWKRNYQKLQTETLRQHRDIHCENYKAYIETGQTP